MRGHILISHTHWDHIQGLPFFTPLFVEGNEWDIYGPGGLGESLREALSGQMRYTYFPVTLDALGAVVRYHDLVEGAFEVGEIDVRTRYLNHPALTLAYRLEADGVTVVYACDHEPHAREHAVGPGELSGQDLEHAEFLRGADLVIHDGQYTAEEYEAKTGWGHSTCEYAVAVCRFAGVERLALTHHDPLHDDEDLDRVVEGLRRRIDDGGPPLDVFAAAEGQVLELIGERSATVEEATEPSAMLRPATAAGSARVLVAVKDTVDADRIEEAASAAGLEVVRVRHDDAIVDRVVASRPSLVILDRAWGGLEASRSLNELEAEGVRTVPVILVAPEPGEEETVTDWLTTPFSVEYARSRIRAWALRETCRWAPAPIPSEEPDRLASLRGLDLLDSGPEERFDRITRLAAGVLGAPVSLFTLVDEERQWFKSRVGMELAGTSREAALCAHTILGREPMIVPDALDDDRFADNPLVAEPPHVRFYAGCPVRTPDGLAAGSLCVMDVRPRRLTETQIGLLRDLADLVEEELARTG